MDIIVECKDKASLLIQRNTFARQPHINGNYLTYTHNHVNGLNAAKSSCPFLLAWKQQKSDTLYKRLRPRNGTDEVTQSSGGGFSRGLVVCL